MIVRGAFFVTGILCLGYFILYASLAGLTNSFTYAWLAAGAALLVAGVFYAPLRACAHALPGWVKLPVAGVAIACVLAVAMAECLCVGYGVRAPGAGADYVIVLGTQVRGRTPSYSLARRLDVAYGYLQQNPGTKAILSGGKGAGEEVTEAQAMEEYLLKKGIAPQRLILEDRSVDTEENIRFSMEKIGSKDASVVLATNRFHLFRSVRLAKKQGLSHVEGLGADVMWYTVPNLYLREAFAILYYAARGHI